MSDARKLGLKTGAHRWPLMHEDETDPPVPHQKLARSADRLEHSAREQTDSADRRTELAADRTVMEQLYARRRLAYAEAHLRIDASLPPAESVERLLHWIGY